ncbi:adenosine kinase [Aristophania vespae]|uniref:Adenosine kinase n=1 Tax=Aristophania vespae TaxID=2697033 RepID=A0A6P1NC79_9PROT|nr:adenosine kinase [Aristophania vespae]QHI95113.1 adenosine kinase [Aristophania vespae]UMM64322.1 putative sugar kinase YdjH [Aristophania vespae]
MSNSNNSVQYDLLCIGNAIVDMTASIEPEILKEFRVAPGSMTLIDAETVQRLTQNVAITQVSGGGSTANSAVVAARMGIKTAYLGKVAIDEAGEDFAADLKEQHIHFPSKPLGSSKGDEEIPTACCIVLVTPDGQRTMFTYLGACVEFAPEDVLKDVVADSAVTYLEGYLFDRIKAQKAFYEAAKIAHEAGRKVALTLSDSFCVERHRDDFRKFILESVDILFANESEILSLYNTHNLEEALAQVSQETNIAAITRGEKGSVIIVGADRYEVPTRSVKVVDTTGAGDAFAAGFLAGYAKGRDYSECARLGNEAAGAIITHLGARPTDNFALKV